MSIIRAPRPESGWSSIANQSIRDKRLSWAATGLLTYLLSLPDNARTDIDLLKGRKTDGRDSTRTALRRLRELGYVRRIQTRGEKGRWVTETFVYDTPEAAAAALEASGGIEVPPGQLGVDDDISAGGTASGPPASGNPPTGSPPTGKPAGGFVLGSKERPSKEELTPNGVSAAKADQPKRDDVERVCAHLVNAVEANGSKRPRVTQKWRDAARLLMDADGRTETQIHTAIDWCQGDEFWRANVLSMPTLREKYDQLRLQAMREQRQNTSRRPTTDQRVAAATELVRKYEALEEKTMHTQPAITAGTIR